MNHYSPGGRPAYWEALDIVGQYQNRRSSGDPFRDPIAIVKDHLASLFGRPRRVLWLGCLEGDPSADISLAIEGFAEEIHVHDIAEGLIAKQRARAQARGANCITYTVTDLNTATFPANHYDAVIGWGTIHHVEALERLFTEVRRTLMPGGMFMMREYIGPTQMQFTPA